MSTFRPLVCIAAFCALCLSSRASSADDLTISDGWRVYDNFKYEYHICYPYRMLKPQGEPDAGDGQEFIAGDGGKLLVFGSFNVEGSALDQIVGSYTSDLIKPHGRLTYRAIHSGWAVVSGENGRDRIFYSKTIKRNDEIAIFQLSYPKALAKRYAPIARRLSQCLAHIRARGR
jgi:hypothetical protein